MSLPEALCAAMLKGSQSEEVQQALSLQQYECHKKETVSFHVVAGPECQESVYESCEIQSLLLPFHAQ